MTKIRPSSRRSESGNILFLVLVAVILFGALTYAVSGATRVNGSNGGISDTNNEIHASQIIQYATYIQSTIERMHVNGTQDTDFCFDSQAWGNADYNSAACSKPENQVFSAAGGGVLVEKPTPGINDGSPWYIAADVCVPGIGIYQGDDCNADNDSSDEDIVMFLPNVSKQICIEINNKLGIQNPGGNPPKAGGNLWNTGMPKFIGAFADGTVINSGGSGDLSILRRQPYGCVEGNGTPPAGTYHYYHVLLGR
jgi:hypothetical protein